MDDNEEHAFTPLEIVGYNPELEVEALRASVLMHTGTGHGPATVLRHADEYLMWLRSVRS